MHYKFRDVDERAVCETLIGERMAHSVTVFQKYFEGSLLAAPPSCNKKYLLLVQEVYRGVYVCDQQDKHRPGGILHDQKSCPKEIRRTLLDTNIDKEI